MAAPIDVARLGPMQELDSGSFGTVYRLESYTLPGFNALAYKRFTSAPDARDIDNLTALVAFRSGLDARSTRILDDAAAWPLQLVTDHGQVCGFIMQLIPPEFFGQQLLPSGATITLPIKGQWLVVDTAKADSANIAVPCADDVPARLVLCAKLAHAFGVLHRAGLVYGDLSLNNVVFSAGEPPRVMLVDCDAAQAPRCAAIAQAHTDDWVPPECLSGHGQDVETDRYKLALFILRVLTPGPHASQATDPARVVRVLDFEGNSLMREGLSADRALRPSAKAWYEYLTRYLGAVTRPPRFNYAHTDSVAALAGAALTLSWRVAGADRVTVTTSDGHSVDCDSPGGQGQHRVTVTRTGAITLRAENPYGTTLIETDPVFVLEPPTISRVEIPHVDIPRVATGEADLAEALTAMRQARVSPRAFAVPDLSPLRALIPTAPDGSMSAPGPALPAGAGAARHVHDLLAALSADARTVADGARAAGQLGNR